MQQTKWPRPRERPRAGLRTPSGWAAWRAATGSVAPPTEKGKGPVSVLLREHRARAPDKRDRCLSLRGAACPIVVQRVPGRSVPRADERKGSDLPITWGEVDEVCGYDVDLDTPDQYAAEDALYLYEGPLPDDDSKSYLKCSPSVEAY